VSALLILTGVQSPLDLPGIDMANFVGYVLWSFWLVSFAVLLPAARPSPRGRRRDRAGTVKRRGKGAW
jgi:hypothetical protein